MNREIKDTTLTAGSAESATPKSEQQVPLNPLLLNLTSVQQAELTAIILEDFRNSKEAREKKTWGMTREKTQYTFDEKMAELYKLYEGDDETRPEPWMCSRSLKIAQAIVEMAVARIFPMVFNEDTLRWKPVRWTNKQYTMLVNRMMFWVLMVWMKVRHDSLMYVRNAAMTGSVCAEAWWERKKFDMDETEQVAMVDEFGQQMMDMAGQPMSIEQRMLRVREMPRIRLIPVTKLYTQPGAKNVHDDSVIVQEEFTFRELETMQKDGLAVNVTDKLLDEVDNRISKESGLTLEKAENVADFNAKRRNMPISCLRWFGLYDADGDGFDEEIVALVAENEEIFLRAYKLAKISRTGKRPLVFKTFIDRIGDKLLGIGLLEQVKPLAEEIDACFRQLTDANTLSVMKWGFYDPNGDYDPDEHVAKPRAMYPVSNPQNNVYFPEMQIPIERLLNAIRLVLEFIERLTAASSYVMGKESDIGGGSGTATRTNAIMSSADTRFNLAATNLREGLAELFTDIFNLCSMNMPEGLEEKILGEDGEKVFPDSESMQASLALEMEAYLMQPADLGDSNTRRQLASLLYDKLILGGNPLVINDQNRIWFGTANLLQAYGEEPSEWIGKPGSVKPSNDPVDEHTMIRDGRYVPVEPQENHMEHIMEHEAEITGPNVLLWPPDRTQYLKAHIEEHKQMIARVMMMMSQQKDTMSQKGGADEAGPESGAARATRGGSALVGGQPDISVAPNQATGTPEQQTSGAAGGRM
jgi:hypothetical protein